VISKGYVEIEGETKFINNSTVGTEKSKSKGNRIRSLKKRN